MRRLLAFSAIFLTDCGAPTTHPEADTSVEQRPAICEPVALHSVSMPTTVVGDGTPASCTQAALQSAADSGGTIVFDCGPEPITVLLASPILFAKETVLDGKGLVTLSGGDTTRILYFDSQYDLTTPRLVVQRMTFRSGRSPAGGDDTAVGGGAIYREGRTTPHQT